MCRSPLILVCVSWHSEGQSENGAFSKLLPNGISSTIFSRALIHSQNPTRNHLQHSTCQYQWPRFGLNLPQRHSAHGSRVTRHVEEREKPKRNASRRWKCWVQMLMTLSDKNNNSLRALYTHFTLNIFVLDIFVPLLSTEIWQSLKNINISGNTHNSLLPFECLIARCYTIKPWTIKPLSFPNALSLRFHFRSEKNEKWEKKTSHGARKSHGTKCEQK